MARVPNVPPERPARRVSPRGPAVEPATGDPGASAGGATPNPSQVVPIPSGINQGLHSAKSATMIQILGMPRDHMNQNCGPVTNEPLLSLVATENVGPFRVTGLKVAMESLRRVFAQVKADQPEVYAALGTAGMLCARLKRNGSGVSNHAWGTALDIKINGVSDGLGDSAHDGQTLAGLAAMAPYFNAEGWYWGVGFSNFEDGMHFEVAEETIRRWKAEGMLGDAVAARSETAPTLSQGDEGAEVRDVQEALAARGYDVQNDGRFGPLTHGAVVDFQAANGLVPDGIVGPETLAALGLTERASN